jgi:hypothetical protein
MVDEMTRERNANLVGHQEKLGFHLICSVSELIPHISILGSKNILVLWVERKLSVSH